MANGQRRIYSRHSEQSGDVEATVEDLFQYLDDHRRLSSHMSQSSWRMGGGQMSLDVDEGSGQRLGSRIRLHGRVMGVPLSVETSVTERSPPRLKTWETTQEPRLLVIGAYRMGFEIKPQPKRGLLRVFIDYDLPTSGLGRLLGRALGGSYARWCVAHGQ